jgi:chromosome partitioning protein
MIRNNNYHLKITKKGVVMKIITVLQQKGGVGKTTTAVNLAGALAAQHKHLKIAVADADVQKSASIWINRGKGAMGVTVHAVAADGDGKNLKAELAAINADIVIIDLPPALAAISLRAAIRADLLLVPTGPSIVDLSATKAAVSICEEALEMNPAKRFLLIPNRVQNNTARGQELRSTLEAWGPVSKAQLSLRVAFAEAAVVGLGVSQYAPESPAAREIGLLAEEVSEMLAI